MTHGRVALSSAIAVAVALSIACNREGADQTSEITRDDAAFAVTQDERQEAAADLRERVAELEREYMEARQEVASGAAEAAAGLREELEEDMQNVRQAIDDLSTTTEENWWDRHEQAMTQTVEDIEADVRRLAGAIPDPGPQATATTGTTGAPFDSRRDRFVDRLEARVEAMEEALADLDAEGTRETEIEDTRARVQKLGEDVDRLRSAAAEDWWDVSRARVTEYVERVEGSIDRLDENEG